MHANNHECNEWKTQMVMQVDGDKHIKGTFFLTAGLDSMSKCLLTNCVQATGSETKPLTASPGLIIT